MNGGGQAAAVQEQVPLSAPDQRGSGIESEGRPSPFLQHQAVSRSAQSAQADGKQNGAENHQESLAPLSKDALKKLSCTTKEETIASLTAKVHPLPPFVIRMTLFLLAAI